MKTLFSRHSTLNTGLPTATVLTGSFISRTVKWFKAVSTWRICPRSGFCTSTFCPQAGIESTATAIQEFQSFFTFPPCHPLYRDCPGGPDLGPPGQDLVHDGVSPCARAVLASLDEGFSPRVLSDGLLKVVVARFTTVVRWRMSLNTSLPSRIVPDPYRIGNGCTRSTAFPSTSTSPFFDI